MDRNYGNVIWTDHALKRLQDRDIKQPDAFLTWRNPDKSKYAQSNSAWIYSKVLSGNEIEVVAKKNETGKWVILSAWSKPVYQKRIKKKKVSLFKNILSRIFGV